MIRKTEGIGILSEEATIQRISPYRSVKGWSLLRVEE